MQLMFPFFYIGFGLFWPLVGFFWLLEKIGLYKPRHAGSMYEWYLWQSTLGVLVCIGFGIAFASCDTVYTLLALLIYSWTAFLSAMGMGN